MDLLKCVNSLLFLAAFSLALYVASHGEAAIGKWDERAYAVGILLSAVAFCLRLIVMLGGK